jgi:hypothetical protein
MSTSITTASMVAELSRRVPIGFTATTAVDALNGAFRWINQQGSFPWMLRKALITPAITTGLFTLPADFDPGRPATLYGSKDDPVPTEIPYKPWPDAVKHQVHQVSGTATQLLSCWSFYATLGGSPLITVTLQGQVFPPEAAKATSLQFVYHSLSFYALTSGAYYFPTPDHFDYFIVELAEAELMRQYRIAGWEVLYKRTTDSLRALLQAYTTTKEAMTPSPELVNNAQNRQAQRTP